MKAFIDGVEIPLGNYKQLKEYPPLNTEVVVGTWYDGRPIYQYGTIITGTIPLTATDDTYPYGVISFYVDDSITQLKNGVFILDFDGWFTSVSPTSATYERTIKVPYFTNTVSGFPFETNLHPEFLDYFQLKNAAGTVYRLSMWGGLYAYNEANRDYSFLCYVSYVKDSDLPAASAAQLSE